MDVKLYRYGLDINEMWKQHLERINKDYYKEKEKNNVLINDLERTDEIYEKNNKNPIIINPKHSANSKPNPKKYFKRLKCGKDFPNKIVTSDVVDYLYDLLYKEDTSWTTIKSKLDQLENFLLFSNIGMKGINDMFKTKDKNTVNLLVMGSGPTGLYVSNYLRNINLLSPKINILMVDNRVSKKHPHTRLPYSRDRVFAIYFNLVNMIYPRLPCLNDLIKKDIIEIKYLEYILIIIAYKKKIPIYFTDELNDREFLDKFLMDNKIDILFDCTGGRLKLFKELNEAFEKANSLSNETRLDIDQTSDGKFLHTSYFFELRTTDDNPYYLNIKYQTDLDMLKELEKYMTNGDKGKKSNRCIQLRTENVYGSLKYFDYFKNYNFSIKMKSILLRNPDKPFNISIFQPKFFYKHRISFNYKVSDHKMMVIGLGDTIFSSHFTIGAGLNRMLTFINQILWHLQMLADHVIP